MLDLNHPRSASILAASHQLDMLTRGIQRITLRGQPHRLYALEQIRPCFAALRWLAEERFEETDAILACLQQFERHLDELARLPVTAPDWANPARCPVCDAEPETVSHPYLQLEWGYCSTCCASASSYLQRLQHDEEGFGTWAI